MISLLTIASIISVAYLFYWVRTEDRTPESLSETYYLLGDKGWIFQVVIALVGIMLLPVWVSVSETATQHLAFVACGGLLFTSVAPAFKLKLEGAVHYSAAIICCASAILWQVLEGLWDITIVFGLLGFTLYLQCDKWCFWLEFSILCSVLSNLWRLV